MKTEDSRSSALVSIKWEKTKSLTVDVPDSRSHPKPTPYMPMGSLDPGVNAVESKLNLQKSANLKRQK